MRDGTGLGSFRRYTWWTLIATIASLLAAVAINLSRAGAPVLVSSAAAGVMAAACLVLLNRRLPRTGLPVGWLVAGSAGACVLGGLALAERDYGLWSLPPAMMVSVVAMFLPRGQRWSLVTASAVAAAVVGGVFSGDAWGFAVVFPAAMVAFTAWVLLGMLFAWDIAERLNHARGLAAELAVKDERLRFAAELHDIQGHQLQVIALKSELAARLVEADPTRAATEMRDVQRLATDTLRDTRAVVHGYRRTTLHDEITNAAKVLAAADIDTRIDAAPETLPEASRHLLGLVMREATTNVLRHSKARHATADYRISAGTATLRISNDGAVAVPRQSPGSGLAALAERLEAAAGTLTWHRDGAWFEVTASLPVNEEDTA